MTTVAVIGGGVMGETLVAGMLRNGWDAGDVAIAEKRADHAATLRDRHGVEVGDIDAVVRSADVVALVVKPQDLPAVLGEVAAHLAPSALVVSLAAGVTTETIEAALAPGTPVVRVMPNTPAQVGAGTAAISPGAHPSEQHLELVEQLMAAVGHVVRVPESQQDAVTAVSGSGPAYVFLVAEAMIEAGVHLGLPRATATELAVHTVRGAATLLDESGTHPALLREQVTSPAGTTAAALRALEDHGLRSAFLAALEAARDRSRELAG
ncbi:pyrroline-5-carboxylate reductase [Mumia flava]|uniref:Pyrroline-5-carboxylate reductase n=1 Tax=Mumia flava TaxID=1348852 RepID=A0A0B2BQL4_9ACTN|nr:pyrroline-5-carboxylate reductase [Mumia flava]PJJ58164.1 pyrroline-5-carboxylate reductase [Mumia flava]